MGCTNVVQFILSKCHFILSFYICKIFLSLKSFQFHGATDEISYFTFQSDFNILGYGLPSLGYGLTNIRRIYYDFSKI